MKILEIASFEESLPPEKYGGIELVVSNVTEGLVAAGQDVYLMASGDSKTSAHLISYFEKSMRAMHPVAEHAFWRDFYNFYLVGQILETINKIKPDIVHNHIGWRLLSFSHLLPCPMMTTMHNPLSIRKHIEMYKRFPQANYISISNSQRSPMPELNWLGTVYNGIDVSRFDFQAEKQDYFAFLGRISPEKGLGAIIQMIRKTKHKLKIGAKLDSSDQEYYEKEVKPYLDGEQIQFLGELDHTAKNELLKNAKASLTWLNRAEPFGLAYVESMACGTPVIINPIGSPAELIINGRTGFLVDTIEQMAQRLDEVDSLDHSLCREQVQKNFSIEKMVDDYIEIAEKLITLV
ncbi:MAG: glycosyltransferase family 4 protein [bacterium]|nr:glycosyltransferase family 4 protein [bacterium]